ncbi:hypothetical protein IF125_13975 [Empedobacter stercoris]|uniref:hypothetical protein n=1 Tax=Empedobacter stercoris TaxID=1628248 RepID=UPI001CE0FDDC|nr:hypothetical protein [Empedobacter stercoris]MCA4783343.1 hypothetical protein [Empedobacter stercoris]
MKEFISRKYNNFYNTLIILVLMIFVLFALLLITTYLDDIITQNKYDVLLFLGFFVLIFLVFIRLNYYINEIIIDYENETIIIKKIFSKKVFKINEIDMVDRYILPYLNYLKINNKNYLFISRSIDPFGNNFTFDSEGDLENIKEILKEFNKK